jgi:hypothetical protein
LYEFVRSKVYSVGLKRTVITLPLSAPSRTVIVAFLSWDWLTTSSQSPALALDAGASIDTADDVLGESIDQPGVEIGELHGVLWLRPARDDRAIGRCLAGGRRGGGDRIWSLSRGRSRRFGGGL